MKFTTSFLRSLVVLIGVLCLVSADDAEIQKHIDRLKNENSVTSSDCQDLSVFNISCDKVADYYIRVLKTSMCSVPQIASRCCASCSGPGHHNRR